jgi:NADH-quinone oxidoreductase subunit A
MATGKRRGCAAIVRCTRARSSLGNGSTRRVRCAAHLAHWSAGVVQLPEGFLLDYLPIIVFFALATALGLAFMLASWAFAPASPDAEKTSAYECGFNAFDDARMKFDVKFYLVSILFILFDLEIAFLFPWVLALDDIGPFGYWSMMSFLGILLVGFIYEWKKGALEWN